MCAGELERPDMTINVKTSTRMRIGPRFNAHGSCITTRLGREILWGDTLRYPGDLGVHITFAVIVECQEIFFLSCIQLFAKVGRIAHENVAIQLLKAN